MQACGHVLVGRQVLAAARTSRQQASSRDDCQGRGERRGLLRQSAHRVGVRPTDARTNSQPVWPLARLRSSGSACHLVTGGRLGGRLRGKRDRAIRGHGRGCGRRRAPGGDGGRGSGPDRRGGDHRRRRARTGWRRAGPRVAVAHGSPHRLAGRARPCPPRVERRRAGEPGDRRVARPGRMGLRRHRRLHHGARVAHRGVRERAGAPPPRGTGRRPAAARPSAVGRWRCGLRADRRSPGGRPDPSEARRRHRGRRPGGGRREPGGRVAAHGRERAGGQRAWRPRLGRHHQRERLADRPRAARGRRERARQGAEADPGRRVAPRADSPRGRGVCPLVHPRRADAGRNRVGGDRRRAARGHDAHRGVPVRLRAGDPDRHRRRDEPCGAGGAARQGRTVPRGLLAGGGDCLRQDRNADEGRVPGGGRDSGRGRHEGGAAGGGRAAGGGGGTPAGARHSSPRGGRGRGGFGEPGDPPGGRPRHHRARRRRKRGVAARQRAVHGPPRHRRRSARGPRRAAAGPAGSRSSTSPAGVTRRDCSQSKTRSGRRPAT